ncbi:hypothetical protein DUNSADRAFT_6698 [Dunaliella salina]|uniref:Uncharacterized protein n=1 Tax=Dunaliella salina TaxID=3046 RepID=A0ABQ7GMP9_DUNSA|nr:hypothetical protein DUNSADRAFT_6698 [Dunaliella salina]|eukprot:KAF5835885.1 hypothetical protein DUNSADRAFT_6698 [Dunaliella salina]
MDPALLASFQEQASGVLRPLGEQYDVLASNSTTKVLILIGHCVACVTAAPEAKGNWLLHYLMTFLLGFGGAMWSSLLLMDPSRAPISWILNNDIGMYFTITWWLVVYSPLSRPLNRLLQQWPIRALPTACVLFFKTRMVASRVELVASLHPGVLLSPIALATLAGCGGMCTYDALRSVYGLNDRPAEVTMAGKSFRVAFLVASIHFCNMLLPQPLLPIAEMRTFLTTLCVAHSLLCGLTGLRLDWTETLLRPVLFIARIPWPSDAPKPLPPASKHTAQEQQKKKAAAAAAAAAKPGQEPQPPPNKARGLAATAQPSSGQEEQPKRKGTAQTLPAKQQQQQQQQAKQQQGGKSGNRRRWDDPAPAAPAPAAPTSNGASREKQPDAGNNYYADAGLTAPNPFAALQNVDESGKRKRN